MLSDKKIWSSTVQCKYIPRTIVDLVSINSNKTHNALKHTTFNKGNPKKKVKKSSEPGKKYKYKCRKGATYVPLKRGASRYV